MQLSQGQDHQPFSPEGTPQAADVRLGQDRRARWSQMQFAYVRCQGYRRKGRETIRYILEMQGENSWRDGV